jgi:hypothetical protein
MKDFVSKLNRISLRPASSNECAKMYQVFSCLSAANVQVNQIKLAAIKFASLSKKVFILLFNQEFPFKSKLIPSYEESYTNYQIECVFLGMSIRSKSFVLQRHYR